MIQLIPFLKNKKPETETLINSLEEDLTKLEKVYEAKGLKVTLAYQMESIKQKNGIELDFKDQA